MPPLHPTPRSQDLHELAYISAPERSGEGGGQLLHLLQTSYATDLNTPRSSEEPGAMKTALFRHRGEIDRACGLPMKAETSADICRIQATSLTGDIRLHVC